MPALHCKDLDNIIWQQYGDGLFILSNRIDIWRIRISSSIQWLSRCSALLNDSEIRRSQNYKQEKDRHRFIISRGVLRILLGRYVNMEPAQIQFDLTEDKKPFIKNVIQQSVHFNTAHSGDWIVIALSAVAVGIDIEKIDPHFNFDDILPTAFSMAETDFIQQSASARNSFYSLWTRKEALVKGLGKGIDDELPLIPCLDADQNISGDITKSSESWNVSSFEMDADHVASLAYPALLPSAGKLYFRDIYSLIKD